jgi:hypothetical protein
MRGAGQQLQPRPGMTLANCLRASLALLAVRSPLVCKPIRRLLAQAFPVIQLNATRVMLARRFFSTPDTYSDASRVGYRTELDR